MKAPNQFRVRDGIMGTDDSYGPNGAFFIPVKHGRKITHVSVIASNSHGWDHVSVSHYEIIPTWEIMCKIKSYFWDAEEAVFQYHPPESQWINYHPRCLHLWRPQGSAIPAPPAFMV